MRPGNHQPRQRRRIILHPRIVRRERLKITLMRRLRRAGTEEHKRLVGRFRPRPNSPPTNRR